MPSPIIEVDTTIAAAPATVWKVMTRRDSAMFAGAKVETDWKVGHPISFSGEWQGKSYTDHGEIRSLAEGKELSFSHWSGSDKRPPSYHLVRYTLEPKGERTKVTLAQFNEGKETEVDASTKAAFKKNWTMMLDGLKQAAEAH